LSLTKLLNFSEINTVGDSNAHQDIENHGADANESYDSEEEEKKRVKEEKRILKSEKAEKSRVYWKTKNQNFIRTMKKLTCFQDYKQKFDDDEKIPTCKQVCCWRFLRAKTQATQFYVSETSLEALEKSKCQRFISVLISFNYLALYLVILLPFYLIFKERLTDKNFS